MTRTVTTIRAAAVTTIPATIGPPEGPTCPMNCASAGLAGAKPRTTIRTPHHAHFDVMRAPFCKCLIAPDNHTRLDRCVIRGPESVGQPTSRAGSNQQCFPRSYFAMCQHQVYSLIKLRDGIVVRFILTTRQPCDPRKERGPNVVIASRHKIRVGRVLW